MLMTNNGKIVRKSTLPAGLMTLMLKKLLRIGRLIEMVPKIPSLNYLLQKKAFY